jgi:hypothetical protein
MMEGREKEVVESGKSVNVGDEGTGFLSLLVKGFWEALVWCLLDGLVGTPFVGNEGRATVLFFLLDFLALLGVREGMPPTSRDILKWREECAMGLLRSVLMFCVCAERMEEVVAFFAGGGAGRRGVMVAMFR